jgi:hypothetical protein
MVVEASPIQAIPVIEKRDNLLTVVVGRKRIGKSNETLRQLLKLAYELKICKSLIFDINNEYGAYKLDGRETHNIKEIKEKDLIAYGAFKGFEVRRIVPKKENGMPMTAEEIDELLCKIIVYFRGGALSIEDLSTMFGANLPIKFGGLLTNNAHRSADIFCSIQNLGRLSPMILENTNYIRLYRTQVSVTKYKTRFSEDFEILRIAEIIINRRYDAGDERFWLYINKDAGKIEGRFSNRELTEAIQIYLSQNKSELGAYINMLDGSGRKIYTYQQAIILKMRELFMKYNGNQKK